MRIGKKEGMNTTNVAKRQVQNVWVKDKLDTQYPGFCILCVLFWFLCGGVVFGRNWQQQCSKVRMVCSWECDGLPQAIPLWIMWFRVWLPRNTNVTSTVWQANEQACDSFKRYQGLVWNILWHANNGLFLAIKPWRLRMYRLFFDRSKFKWRGPSTRELSANDMLFLSDDKLVPLMGCIFCSFLSDAFFNGMCGDICWKLEGGVLFQRRVLVNFSHLISPGVGTMFVMWWPCR